MKCSQNTYCPWVQNSQDQDHYVCLKCDKEKHLNESNPLAVVLTLLVITFLLVTLLGCGAPPAKTSDTSDHPPKKEQEEPPPLPPRAKKTTIT